ncbi:hypothetical protein [Novosphingobium sp. M1R2S20]|uniref:Uncharacterized protein n=1 Tax=Novosphingobium rhizovicinum TaxID=3228928 RepID=A0ABV3R6X9_9SPHN
MRAELIVSIVTVLGALFLVWRGLVTRSMERGQRLKFALIWAVIIIAVVLVVRVLQSGGMAG